MAPDRATDPYGYLGPPESNHTKAREVLKNSKKRGECAHGQTDA